MGCGGGRFCGAIATASLRYSSASDPAAVVPLGGGAGISVPWYTFLTNDAQVFETSAAGGGTINTAGNVRLQCKRPGLYMFAQAVAWPNANYTRNNRITWSIGQLGLAATAVADTGQVTGVVSAFVAPPMPSGLTWVEFEPVVGSVVVQAINFDPANNRAIISAQLLAVYFGPTRRSAQVY